MAFHISSMETAADAAALKQNRVIGRLNEHHRRNPEPPAQGLYLPGVQPAFPT
jgi:hypothetical protein